MWRTIALGMVLGLGGCAELETLVANFNLALRGRTTGPYLQMDGPDRVVVAWFTTEPLVGELEVMDTDAEGNPDAATARRLTEDAATTHHLVRIEGLEPGGTYAYRLLGPAATSDDFHRLAPIKTDDEPIVFAVFGDSGRGWPGQFDVAARMNEHDPDYVLITGDVVYPDGADAHYDRAFFGPYVDLMDHVPFFPSLGNHDVAAFDGAAYLQNFILPENGPAGMEPERCYSIDLGNVHVVSIDSNFDALTTNNEIVPWLLADLAGSDATWKFVFFHHPVYTTGTPTRPMSAAAVATWAPVFDEAGVDLCLAGHNHFYERSVPLRGGEPVALGQGTVYVVSGNGGAGLYPLAEPADFSALTYNENYGFTRVTVDGRQIEIAHINAAGVVIDQVSWDKPAP